MRRILLNTLLSMLMMATSAVSAFAIPARPGIITYTQPDGTTLRVMIKGDERCHYYTTEDGYLLINHEDMLYYGRTEGDAVVNSWRRATDIALRPAADRAMLSAMDAEGTISRYVDALQTKRKSEKAPMRIRKSAGPGLFPGTQFPSKGEQKGLVVLVQYQDVKFNLQDPYSYFSRLLNEPGFSDNGATGSARDFYVDSSSGQFLPDFDVYGPITLANKRAYYGKNTVSGDDQHPEEMAIEACQQLDDTVDFTEYDRDGDGYIDNVYVFYAGTGENAGGPSTSVWPHSWDIEEAGRDDYPIMFDGVILNRYACSNEWYDGEPDGIGTFCHEFGHVMGLPDLYPTSYSGAFTPGSFDAMDEGSYNNNSMTPPSFSAFERYALGWLEPEVIDGPMDCELQPLTESNKAYIIHTPKDNEYFLLENRQQQGFDRYIPGHGMLVWHIDYKASVWTDNTVNDSKNHQYVDIEEADNVKSESTRKGDPFPGTGGITEFTDDTKPWMKTWSNERLELPLTDIAESNTGVITFKAAGGKPMGIENVSSVAQAPSVNVEGCTVTITAADATPVSVSDSAGRIIANGTGSTAITLPGTGLYLVTVGTNTHKVWVP